MFTPKEIIKLFGGNEGRQLIDRIVKSGYCSREYLVDNEWVDQPKGRVTGVRYNISPIKRELPDIADIWRYMKNEGIQSPSYPDRILKQLFESRSKDFNLRLFSPWGPRYRRNTPKITEQDSEIKTIREIKEKLKKFVDCGYQLEYLLMFADTYGTEVNRLSSKFVDEYYKNLVEIIYVELERLGNVKVKRWSEIREENKEKYCGLRSEVNKNFDEYVKEGEFERAVKTAKVFNPENSENSAREYCIERVVEGKLIGDIYSPIKLSLVRKEKDILDGLLKRIYIIKNRAPWLGGEK